MHWQFRTGDEEDEATSTTVSEHNAQPNSSGKTSPLGDTLYGIVVGFVGQCAKHRDALSVPTLLPDCSYSVKNRQSLLQPCTREELYPFQL